MNPMIDKEWEVFRTSSRTSKVKASSIEWARHHVVFKSYEGIVVKAFRAEDVLLVTLLA